MKIAVLAVGKVKGAAGEAIGEYEARARRYFAFESHEVEEEQYRSRGDDGKPVGTLDSRYRDDEHCLLDTIIVR